MTAAAPSGAGRNGALAGPLVPEASEPSQWGGKADVASLISCQPTPPKHWRVWGKRNRCLRFQPMPTPTPGTWLSLLFELSARRRADAAPWRASLNLSTTTPQSTPPTENFQTEIATVVAVAGQRFTLSSGGGTTLQISRSTDPAVTAPSLVQRLEYGNVPASASAAAAVWVSQAVASFGSLVAVALSPDDHSGTATRAASGGKGIVRFYRANANGSLTVLQDVSVGYLPDSIAFNSTGSQLVIANEGEPTRDYQINGVDVDRPGSIGIKNASGTPSFTYTELGFAGLSLPAGIRISGKAGLSTQATDIEPEYVSINGNFADVTLQENNGVAKVICAPKRSNRSLILARLILPRSLWTSPIAMARAAAR